MSQPAATTATRPHHGRDVVAPPSRSSAATLAIFVLVVGVVIAADPAGLAPFGPLKWAVATTATWALAAVLSRRRLRAVRVPTLVLAGLVVWTGVVAVAGVDPLYAWIGTPERHWGVLAWVLCLVAFVAGQALQGNEQARVAEAATVAVGLVGLWSLAELLGWEPFALTGVTDRPGGPFGSSAYLGAATALLAPAAVGLALHARRSPLTRVVATACAALGAIALVASGARAAWVGVAIVVVVTLALRRRDLSRRVVAALGAALVLGVLIAVVTGVGARVPDLVTDERGGMRGRLDEWRVAARVVAEHPVVGVGPEGYRIAFAEGVDADYEARHGRHPLPDRAHAALLDVAATTGIPGALAYAVLLALVGRFLLRGIRNGAPVVAGVAAGVLAYFAQSLVLFPIPELDVVAWLSAGMVVAVVARGGEGASWRPNVVVTGVVVVVAAVAAVAGVLDVAADRTAKQALEHDSSQAATRAVDFRPDALRHHLVAARVHESAGRIDDAAEHLQRALDVSRRDPIVRGELARLLLERARRTEAPADITRASQELEALANDDPHNAEVQLRLGLALALDGNEPGAERAWLAAERLAPRSAAASTNLALAYARAGRTADAQAAARRALSRDPGDERAAQVLRMTDGT